MIEIKYKGKIQGVNDWSLELGIPLSTIYSRLKLGWPPELVLSKKRFDFCYSLKAAVRVQQFKGYPKDQHIYDNGCCTTNSICSWAIALTPWEEIRDNPSEGNYYCELLDQFVVGKDPKCNV